jgi:hypothetical protein
VDAVPSLGAEPEKIANAPAAVEPGSSTATRRRSPRKRKAKIPRLKRWDCVLVEWLDAVTHEEPWHSNNTPPIPIRRSIGHFLRRTPDAIVIAMEDDRLCVDLDSDCQTVTSIVLGMVRAVTVLIPKP